MSEKSVKLEVITGVGKGNTFFMPKLKLISIDPYMPFKFTRIQFPLRLAFAIIIKAQGQTFTNVGIYLKYPPMVNSMLLLAGLSGQMVLK